MKHGISTNIPCVTRILKDQKLEARMEKALTDEEFLIFVQPKYWLASRGLAGGEILVRWKIGGEGMLSPGEFIPLIRAEPFHRQA